MYILDAHTGTVTKATTLPGNELPQTSPLIQSTNQPDGENLPTIIGATVGCTALLLIGVGVGVVMIRRRNSR